MFNITPKETLQEFAILINSKHFFVVTAKGFSTKVCFPLFNDWIPRGTCVVCGVAISTASIFLSLKKSLLFVKNLIPGNLFLHLIKSNHQIYL